MSAGLPALVVFAKCPERGRSKTRLAAGVGEEAAFGLSRAFLLDTLGALGTVPGVCRVLAQAAGDWSALAEFLDGWECVAQGEGDLGARQARVFSAVLARAPSAVLLGTDFPGLPVERVAEAFGHLSDHDAVLGLADDGGYYLVGLRRMVSGLFDEVPWSTDATASVLRERLARFGLTTAFVPGHFDVDRPADLGRLAAMLRGRPDAAPRTARVLVELGFALDEPR